MRNNSKLSILLLCACSSGALTSTALAQTQNSVEAVTVTGSRVISDPLSSPTPLTVVSTDDLQQTTPTTLADGLNKLPVFQNSQSPSGVSASFPGSAAGSVNTLNLRNFGASRTLVLMDGHRVVPANANGTVDVDNLPEMLVGSIDVVTGGASAVYGSDAVTGVVNYVLDKHFNGFKFDINSGISNYGDALSYKLSAAAGADLFGGRGHIEGTLRHFYSDPVNNLARPSGQQNWILTGAGTVANPYVNTIDSHNSGRDPGGLIFNCATPAGPQCPVNGFRFSGNGVLSPFNRGVLTGSSSINSGGDGSDIQRSSAFSGQHQDNAFGRFSYDLSSSATVWMNVNLADAQNTDQFVDSSVTSQANSPNTFFTNNPFLPPATQAQFGTATTFQLSKAIQNLGQAGPRAISNTRQASFTIGADGKLAEFDWDIFYTHGDSRQSVKFVDNTNNQRFFAAEDAVQNSSGQTVCYVSTTQYASLYPGCVALDPFGPTAVTPGMYNYITGTTHFIQDFVEDNVGASVSGNVLELPAGPVKVAISAESRWLDWNVTSNASPTQLVDCTGLRNCNPNALVWPLFAVASVAAKQSVYEFAGEAEIPVLKDVPLIQSFNLNLAGRYTNYSTSGEAETWKIGTDWQVNNDVRLRATTSIDIRAPTLNDLFQPPTISPGGYTDIHTATNAVVAQVRGGNPALVPEVARTYSAGIVATPSFINGLSASLDYYHIRLKNAIGVLAGYDPNVENLCEAANGTGPICALYVRPLPFSNRTPANYPTKIFVQNVNAAANTLEGWDFETNYRFALGDLFDGTRGDISLRALMTYQPVYETQAFAGAPTVYCASDQVGCNPKTRATFFANYNLDDWSFGVQDRWFSGFKSASVPTVIYATPRVKSYDMFDINIDKTFEMSGGTFDGYMIVQNVANSPEPLDVFNSATPGEYLPVWNGHDAMGRYFTIGLRAKF